MINDGWDESLKTISKGEKTCDGTETDFQNFHQMKGSRPFLCVLLST